MESIPPPGFVLESSGAITVLVDGARRERLMEAGLGRPSQLLEGARPRRGGRGATFDLTLGGEDLVLRLHRRGGIPRLLLKESTFDRTRSLREIAALAAARARGVPVVEPVAAVVTAAGLGLHRHFVLTVAERGAVDLLEALADPRAEEGDHRSLVDAAGRVVRAAFEAGIEHRDLHPRNLLVTETEPRRCLLVDLDRARVEPGPLPPSLRIAALARFAHYLDRHRYDGARVFSRSDWLRLVRASCGGDWRRIARTARERNAWLAFARWPGRRRARARSRDAGVQRVAGRGPYGTAAAREPVVSFVLLARGADGAARSLRRVLEVCRAAGLEGYEVVVVARDDRASEAVRALSRVSPPVRFLAEPVAARADAWRAGLRGARGRAIVLLRGDALDARFLTDALQRLEGACGAVAGVRGAGSRDARAFLRRAGETLLGWGLRLLRRSSVRDPFSSVAVRRDDRFEAALRAVRRSRSLVPELLARLEEAGTRLEEIPVDVLPEPDPAAVSETQRFSIPMENLS